MGLTLAVGIIITRLQRDKNNESRTATYEYQIFILGKGKGKPYGTGIDFASWNELRTLFNCGWEIEAVLAEDSQSVDIVLRREIIPEKS